MFLNLNIFVFSLLSSDEVVVKYYHDIIPKNIAPLASCSTDFVNSYYLLSKSLKTIKGRQEKCRLFGSMCLYPRMTVVIELNLFWLASHVESLLKFSLKVFATSPVVDLIVPVSKVDLVVFPCSLHLIQSKIWYMIIFCGLLLNLVKNGFFSRPNFLRKIMNILNRPSWF